MAGAFDGRGTVIGRFCHFIDATLGHSSTHSSIVARWRFVRSVPLCDLVRPPASPCTRDNRVGSTATDGSHALDPGVTLLGRWTLWIGTEHSASGALRARCDFVNFGSRFHNPLAWAAARPDDTSPTVTHISLAVRTQCEHSASGSVIARCDIVNFGSRFHKPLARAVVRRVVLLNCLNQTARLAPT